MIEAQLYQFFEILLGIWKTDGVVGKAGYPFYIGFGGQETQDQKYFRSSFRISAMLLIILGSRAPPLVPISPFIFFAFVINFIYLIQQRIMRVVKLFITLFLGPSFNYLFQNTPVQATLYFLFISNFFFSRFNFYNLNKLIFFIIITNNLLMNKCEHGEPITLFCLSDHCMWRDAGGCPTCFKKFHNQAQNSDPLPAEKLEQLCKRFIYEPDTRLKSKSIQQSVCNYFIIMKNQLTMSIDAISKSIINKLSYPFLSSQGQYTTFRKIKSKQYRKISKKQLKSFMNFVSPKDRQTIESKDQSIYIEEIKQLKEVIKNINEAFIQYSRAIEKIDSNFSVQKSFYNKILQNVTTVLHDGYGLQDRKVKSPIDPAYTNYKPVESTDAKKEEISYLNVSRNKVEKTRKVSLDVGLAQQIGKLVIGATQLSTQNSKIGQTENYSQNERQIMEKKKKLFELLNTPNNRKQDEQEERAKKSDKSSRKGSQEQSEAPEYKININVVQKAEKIEQKPLENDKQKQKDHGESHNFEKIEQNEKIKADNQNFFNDLLGKGINLHEFILHTILPREPSRQKLYEDTKEVKEKKVKVEVNFDDQEEASSPILKRKKQIEKSQKRELDTPGKSNQIKFSFQQENQELKAQKKQDQKFQLKDKEAQSIALLLQSLSLPAQKAVPLLEGSIRYAYNNLSSAEYLSFIYLQLQKPKQCLQLCNRILQQIQDSPHANQLSIHIKNNKAAALNMLGRYSQSITILEQCLLYCKRDIIYKNLGDAYFSIGIYEKACPNYEHCIRLNDHMDEAYYNLSVCYFLQDHLHEARLNILKALKLSPRNDQYINLSREIMLKIQE